MRALATVEKVLELLPHHNADTLEIAKIKGWQVIVKKGEHKVNDLVVYLEIDSWVPKELAPFLFNGKSYNGIEGERLRTIKLRGELSQGLVLPLMKVYNHFYVESLCKNFIRLVKIGQDLTEFLKIQKWEHHIPAQLSGQMLGHFPDFIPKTDQLRIQNCYEQIAFLDNYQHGGIDWNVEEKLHGSSCTVYFNNDKIGVCSRNIELKLEDHTNSFILTTKKQGYLEGLTQYKRPIAIQGELCGPGIEGNYYQLNQHCLYVFDVYLIDEQRYALASERQEILDTLKTFGVNIHTVPYLIKMKLPTLQECLSLADGKSIINEKQPREGVVFKTSILIDGQVKTFKVVSNKFLLKTKD